MKEGDGKRITTGAGVVGMFGVMGAIGYGVISGHSEEVSQRPSSETPDAKKQIPCSAPRLGDTEPQGWLDRIAPEKAAARDLHLEGYCVDKVEYRTDDTFGPTIFAEITEGNCEKKEVPVTEVDLNYTQVPSAPPGETLYVPAVVKPTEPGYLVGGIDQYLEPVVTKEDFKKKYNC